MQEVMFTNQNEKIRCSWCLGFQEYIDYHDNEWGVPVHDDKTHFEFLILEGAQAGLSWSTILKKRNGYRKAFDGFEVDKISLYNENDEERLMQDPSIVRNRLKIKGAINNAIRFKEVQNEFGTFNNYIWSFVGGQPIVNYHKSLKEVPPTSVESEALSKDLKNRGFKFVGSTVMYAHMQAAGLVNDHLVDCFRHIDLVKKL
jgi:DNA-3-methyladenine glycosylase I